ncbi:MAG: phosphoribosylformylglycinamidine synthase subunit PurQ [Candidatus Hydrogenedentota bacterium]
MSVRAIVLTGFGINCDNETEAALKRAGAEADRVHLNDIITDVSRLDAYHIFAVPGGFSFGDDVASGKILANRLRYKLGDALQQWVQDGKLMVGICNGFQVLVKMGILPLFEGEFAQDTTLTHNDSGRFEDRWVHLKTAAETKCIWLNGITGLALPVRHGEGKFVPRNDKVLKQLKEHGQVALRYTKPDGTEAAGAFPWNPNGSIDDIAGICDPSGRILGMMPHPEAFVDRTNHPTWTRDDVPAEGAGLQLFRNAVEYVKANLV